MINFYHPIEGAGRSALRSIQEERLAWTLDHAYVNSALYRRKLDESGVVPRNFGGVEDLGSLPFTTKDELREAFPYGALATPLEEVSYFGITSGTTGKPIAVYLSGEDSKNMAAAVARAYHSVGMDSSDIGQLMVAPPMAWMWENSFRLLGMGVINSGIGNAQAQVASIRDLRATVLVSTPSYLLRLAEVGADMDFDPAKSDVRVLVPVAEPFGEETRSRLESAWSAEAYDGYGCMELANGFVECPAKNGHHVFADHFLVEVVNPQTGEQVEPGESGEFVFTTLTRKSTPLVRYRTRDIVHVEEDTCICGRTHPRIFLHGRLDDMVKVKGSTVFPRDLERALMAMGGISNYQAILKREGSQDAMVIKVESSDTSSSARDSIIDSVKGATNITPGIEFVAEGSLSTGGKTKRFIDSR